MADRNARRAEGQGYAEGLARAAQMLELSPQTIRLHAGEMTAQEMRTVQAVLTWLRGKIQAEARKP